MFRQLMESFRNDLRTNPKMVKIMAGFLGTVLVVAVISIGIALYEPDAPDPANAKLNDIEQYMASDSFARMAVADRRDYMNRVTARIKNTDGEGMGGFLKRLYDKNKSAGDAMQINMLSERLKPISQLDDRQRTQKLNTMINVAEMTQGRQKMQQNYDQIFGGSDEQKNKIMTEAIRALPGGMKSTTPKERKNLIKTLKLARQQMDWRYGSSSKQPASSK